MFLNLLNNLQPDTLPMQHDGVYALMSWRDLGLAKQLKAGGNEGWLLLLVFALWLPLLFLA